MSTIPFDEASIQDAIHTLYENDPDTPAKRWYEQGGEFKEMALSAFTETELNPIRNEWNSKILGKMTCGYFLYDSEINKANKSHFQKEDKDIYNTEKQAKSALAYAQLTQLMALPEYNGDWVPDWGNETQLKHCIEMDSMNIVSVTFSTAYSKLSFKTVEIRNRFLNNNYDLLKEYFELD